MKVLKWTIQKPTMVLFIMWVPLTQLSEKLIAQYETHLKEKDTIIGDLKAKLKHSQ